MIDGMPTVIFIGRVLLVIAAITTTSFPILYSRVAWYRSILGQALMLLASTLAAAILLKLFLTFFSHSPAREVLLWVNVGTLLLIIISTSTLTYLQWSIRRKVKRGEPIVITSPLLSNKMYDVLKTITTIVLPGVGALYFALAQIWGFPAAEQVVGTIAAVNVFFGLLLRTSSKGYNSDDSKYVGSVDYSTNDSGGHVVTFNVTPGSDAETWADKKEVTFKVNS
jgi:hypothetical protein